MRKNRSFQVLRICFRQALDLMDDNMFARFLELAELRVEEAGWGEFRWRDPESEP